MNQPAVQLSQASLNQAELPNLNRPKQSQNTILVNATPTGVFIAPQNLNTSLFASLPDGRILEVSAAKQNGSINITSQLGEKIAAQILYVRLNSGSSDTSEPNFELVATKTNTGMLTPANKSFQFSISA